MTFSAVRESIDNTLITLTIPGMEVLIDFSGPCTDVDRGSTVTCVVDSFLCRLRRLAPCWSVAVSESLCLLDGTVNNIRNKRL